MLPEGQRPLRSAWPPFFDYYISQMVSFYQEWKCQKVGRSLAAWAWASAAEAQFGNMMFWEMEKQPDKQTGWSGGKHTQLWQRNPQHHMVMEIVYVACLTLLSLITLIILKFMLPTQILAWAILVKAVAWACLWRCSSLHLRLVLSPSHTHTSPFLCLSLPTALATLPHSVFHGLSFSSALQTK